MPPAASRASLPVSATRGTASTSSDTGCVIGPKIVVRGSLSGEEDLVVEGRVEGRVTLVGHLIVAPGGTALADIDATSVEVRGEVRGDIVASRSITIERGAVVAGNVRAPRVMIHDGAHFDGAIDMDVELPDGFAGPGQARGRSPGRSPARAQS